MSHETNELLTIVLAFIIGVVYGWVLRKLLK